MGIIEYHQGCNNRELCFGPQDNFYTVFGTELRFLTWHIVISIIFGAIVFWALLSLKKNGKTRLSIYLLAILSVVVAVFLFLIFAFFFPVRVVY